MTVLKLVLEGVFASNRFKLISTSEIGNCFYNFS